MKLRSETRREQASLTRTVVLQRITKNPQRYSSSSTRRVARNLETTEASSSTRKNDTEQQSGLYTRSRFNCAVSDKLKQKVNYLKKKIREKTKLVIQLQKEQQETIDGLTEIKKKLRKHFDEATKNIQTLRKTLVSYENRAAKFDAMMENNAEVKALMDIERAPERDRNVVDAMKCLVCLGVYREGKWPVVGRCGHSVCETCTPQLQNCPTCRHQNAFQDNTKNFSIIDLINAVRQRQT